MYDFQKLIEKRERREADKEGRGRDDKGEKGGEGQITGFAINGSLDQIAAE